MIELDPTILIIMGEVIVALIVMIIGILVYLFKTKKRDQAAVQALQGKIDGNKPQRQELFESVLESSLGDEDSSLRKEMASSWVDKENEFYGRLVDMYLKRNSKALTGLDKLLHEYTSSYIDLVTLMRERIESENVELSDEARAQLGRLAEEGNRLNGRVKSLEGENRRLNKELQDAYLEIEQAMREYSKAFRPKGSGGQTTDSKAAVAGVASAAGLAAESISAQDTELEGGSVTNEDVAGLAAALDDFAAEGTEESSEETSTEAPTEESVPVADLEETELSSEEPQVELDTEVALAELPGEEEVALAALDDDIENMGAVGDSEAEEAASELPIDESELNESADSQMLNDVEESVQLASLPEDADEILQSQSQSQSQLGDVSDEADVESVEETPPIIDEDFPMDGEADTVEGEVEENIVEEEALPDILDEESFFAPKDEEDNSITESDEDSYRPVIDLAEDDDTVLSSLNDLLSESKEEREIPDDEAPVLSEKETEEESIENNNEVGDVDPVDEILNQVEPTGMDELVVDEDDLLAQLNTIEDDMEGTGLTDSSILQDDEETPDKSSD